jgi:DNA polymerase-3 subunit epsilon/ATP-dependent DNA helicase DinG
VLGATHDPDLADAAAELEAALSEIRALDAAVGRVVHLPPRGEICWLALDQTGAIALQSAPAHAGAQIDRALARDRHAAVFTSATLAVAGSFRFVLDRFGLGDRASTLRVGSGFDYRRQALLVLPAGLVDPYDAGFVDQTAGVVAEIAERLQGRTLVLFTSHAMLRAVQGRLLEWSERERILLLAQSGGGSRRQLLEQFVEGRAVLLGTSTFWEGIDLPGELLQCVVIAKLPFPVPDDPLVAGRSERYDDPFREYHVPIAALRLRQGFGRLIRRREDRGAVVLLDRRLSSRTYGETFLRSLPECEVARPALSEVATTVEGWIQNARRLERDGERESQGEGGV